MRQKLRFKNVSLPAELVDEVDKLVGHHGYRSRADVIVDAVRRLLREQLRLEVRAK